MLSLTNSNTKIGVGFTIGMAVGAILVSMASRGSGGSGGSGDDPSSSKTTTKASTTDAKTVGETKSAGQSTTSSASDGSVYETAKAVAEYLQFHYGDASHILPFPNHVDTPVTALDFPKRCAAIVAKYAEANGVRMTRGLDVGCAVGAQSFALARHFTEVVGFDFSKAFVQASKRMQAEGSLPYEFTIESDITGHAKATVPGDIDRTRVTFQEGDACNIKPSLGKFDAVFAGNLLCRLPEPTDFILRLPTLVNQGGIVVIVSPYSWLTQYTKREKWIGGYYESKKPVFSTDRLRELMEPEFELLGEEEVPFLIREHRRKYQWGCSEALVWKKR